MPAVADLHTHSSASDGTLSPAALIGHARAQGVSMLALTDHDTTAGLDEAAAAAEGHGLRFVPGIEISVSWENKPLHLVGLAIDAAAPALRCGIARLEALRMERAGAIGARLARLGFADAYAGACREAGNPWPGRMHFARYLAGTGRIATVSDAFSRLLRRGKPAYVATSWPTLGESIEWITRAGGVAVLAHPLRYDLTGAWLRRLAAAFAVAGGRAIEVVSGRQRHAGTGFITDLAHRQGLYGSVGSDFHTPGLSWSELGPLPAMPQAIPPVWELFTVARE